MRFLIIHHTGGTESDPSADTSLHTFEQVNEYHRQKWNFQSSLGYYIGYHYFIEKDGKVTQGRADADEGAHTIGHNDNIGICLAGNFDVTMPTLAQKIALKNLLKDLIARHSIPAQNIVPHRHFAAKSCYGRNLADTWAADLVANDLPAPTRTELERTLRSLLVQLIIRLKDKLKSYV